MFPRRITHRNIVGVLIAGFSLVILLLREQAVTNRLIDELHSQQTTLSKVFSVLARDPDSVDVHIMAQLDWPAARSTASRRREGKRPSRRSGRG